MITIVATTYCPEGDAGTLRADAAIVTMDTWEKNVRTLEQVKLVIADDGSAPVHWSRLKEWAGLWRRGPVVYTQGRGGVGASLNRGFDAASGDVILYAVDDWALTYPFNVDPWVRLLRECEDVGVCRLGPPHPGNVMTAKPYTEDWQGWAARLSLVGVVASQRPALWHRRMLAYYGPFLEDVNALECEAEFDSRLTDAGPAVVLAMPHPWQHIDSVELADVDPKERV